jgi:hypothetical protein
MKYIIKTCEINHKLKKIHWLDYVGPCWPNYECIWILYTYWNSSWIVLIRWFDNMGWIKECLNGVKGQWLNIVKTLIVGFKKCLDVYCIFVGLFSNLSKCYIDIL